MMEIGSEYHINLSDIEVSNNNIYMLLKDYNTFFTAFGRTAIRLLYQYLSERQDGHQVKVLLPAYICDSVLTVFHRKNIVFYDLKEGLEIDECSVGKLIVTGHFDGGIFYLMHYFGKITPFESLEKLRRLCKDHQITILEDTTHSIFTSPCTIGDFCLASLRKWMAIPEGGVVYSKNPLPEEWGNLPHAHSSHKIEAMMLKSLFLGYSKPYIDFEENEFVNDAYRNMFVNEERKIGKEIQGISDLSAFLIMCQDVEQIMDTRRRNYQYLSRRLQKQGIFLYSEKQNQSVKEFVPFTAVILLDERADRDSFRDYLGKHKIYCAVHWPIRDDEQLIHPNVKRWTRQIISLPIDQRYGIKEMDYLADKVISYFKGSNYAENINN